MKKNNQDNKGIITITKKSIKKLMVGSALLASLLAASIGGINKSYKKNQGAEYIARCVKESGILPKNLSSIKLSNGIFFCYEDANGRMINVNDSDSFVEEIIDTALGYGFSIDEIAIFLKHRFDWNGTIEGATKEGKENTCLEAYYKLQLLEQEQELGGKSR